MCSATRRASCRNGQKQRTALARALVRGPGVLLLDDPLRNVDAKLRYEMRLELPRAAAQLRLDRDLRDPGLQGGDGAGRPRRRAARRRSSSRSARRRAIYGDAGQRRDRAAVRRSHDQPLSPAAQQAEGGADVVRRSARSAAARLAAKLRRPRRAWSASGPRTSRSTERRPARPGRARRGDAAQRARRALSARPRRRGAAGDLRRGRRRCASAAAIARSGRGSDAGEAPVFDRRAASALAPPAA